MADIEVPGSGLDQWILDHINLYLKDPEAAHFYDGLPTLLLIVRGRKSGKLRPMPLIYGKSDDKYVIVASKGGAPEHPEWYENLLADPNCEIRVGSTEMNARARVAKKNERASLWLQMTQIYPPYLEYEKAAAPRQIPIVLLEPGGLIKKLNTIKANLKSITTVKLILANGAVRSSYRVRKQHVDAIKV